MTLSYINYKYRKSGTHKRTLTINMKNNINVMEM